jgi:hypothetical protein
MLEEGVLKEKFGYCLMRAVIVRSVVIIKQVKIMYTPRLNWLYEFLGVASEIITDAILLD